MSTPNRFSLFSDSNRFNSLIPSAPAYVDNIYLSPNAPQLISVPSAASLVLFNSTGDFFVKVNATGAIPTANFLNGTGLSLNPSAWTVDDKAIPVTGLGFIAPTSTIVTLHYYSES